MNDLAAMTFYVHWLKCIELMLETDESLVWMAAAIQSTYAIAQLDEYVGMYTVLVKPARDTNPTRIDGDYTTWKYGIPHALKVYSWEDPGSVHLRRVHMIESARLSGNIIPAPSVSIPPHLKGVFWESDAISEIEPWTVAILELARLHHTYKETSDPHDHQEYSRALKRLNYREVEGVWINKESGKTGVELTRKISKLVLEGSEYLRKRRQVKAAVIQDPIALTSEIKGSSPLPTKPTEESQPAVIQADVLETTTAPEPEEEDNKFWLFVGWMITSLPWLEFFCAFFNVLFLIGLITAVMRCGKMIIDKVRGYIERTLRRNKWGCITKPNAYIFTAENGKVYTQSFIPNEETKKLECKSAKFKESRNSPLDVESSIMTQLATEDSRGYYNFLGELFALFVECVLSILAMFGTSSTVSATIRSVSKPIGAIAGKLLGRATKAFNGKVSAFEQVGFISAALSFDPLYEFYQVLPEAPGTLAKCGRCSQSFNPNPSILRFRNGKTFHLACHIALDEIGRIKMTPENLAFLGEHVSSLDLIAINGTPQDAESYLLGTGITITDASAVTQDAKDDYLKMNPVYSDSYSGSLMNSITSRFYRLVHVTKGWFTSLSDKDKIGMILGFAMVLLCIPVFVVIAIYVKHKTTRKPIRVLEAKGKVKGRGGKAKIGQKVGKAGVAYVKRIAGTGVSGFNADDLSEAHQLDALIIECVYDPNSDMWKSVDGHMMFDSEEWPDNGVRFVPFEDIDEELDDQIEREKDKERERDEEPRRKRNKPRSHFVEAKEAPAVSTVEAKAPAAQVEDTKPSKKNKKKKKTYAEAVATPAPPVPTVQTPPVVATPAPSKPAQAAPPSTKTFKGKKKGHTFDYGVYMKNYDQYLAGIQKSAPQKGLPTKIQDKLDGQSVGKKIDILATEIKSRGIKLPSIKNVIPEDVAQLKLRLYKKVIGIGAGYSTLKAGKDVGPIVAGGLETKPKAPQPTPVSDALQKTLNAARTAADPVLHQSFTALSSTIEKYDKLCAKRKEARGNVPPPEEAMTNIIQILSKQGGISHGFRVGGYILTCRHGDYQLEEVGRPVIVKLIRHVNKITETEEAVATIVDFGREYNDDWMVLTNPFVHLTSKTVSLMDPVVDQPVDVMCLTATNGYCLERGLIISVDQLDRCLYNAATEPGTSGMPVYSGGSVIGMHIAGEKTKLGRPANEFVRITPRMLNVCQGKGGRPSAV